MSTDIKPEAQSLHRYERSTIRQLFAELRGKDNHTPSPTGPPPNKSHKRLVLGTVGTLVVALGAIALVVFNQHNHTGDVEVGLVGNKPAIVVPVPQASVPTATQSNAAPAQPANTCSVKWDPHTNDPATLGRQVVVVFNEMARSHNVDCWNEISAGHITPGSPDATNIFSPYNYAMQMVGTVIQTGTDDFGHPKVTIRHANGTTDTWVLDFTGLGNPASPKYYIKADPWGSTP